MLRNRPADSSRRARPVSTRKIDIPVLVVSTLTVVFATLFATLLLLRPESSNPREPMPAGSDSVQVPPPVNAPPLDLPQVNAPPPERILSAEPETHPILNPELRDQLEQLGVKCAEGANCYSD